ncbi:MAG: NADH-quinone oxidoreductase subunit K, partial [Candidatus Aminicenantes bacterium]
MIPLNLVFILSLILFAIGLIAFFVKRDLITMFMAV